MTVIALLISYIPSLLIYFWLRNMKDDPDHRRTCRKLLRNGMLVVLGVTLFSLTANILWALLAGDKVSPLLDAAFHDFILAALSEETVKLCMAGRLIKKNRGTISWLDTAIYVTIVGIGFTLVEDVVYMFSTSIIHILVRGLTSLHVFYGMFMGWYIGKSRYTGKKRYAVIGFLVPWFLHGMYDFSLSEEFGALNDNLVFVPFLVILVTLIIGIRMILNIRKAKNDDQYLTPVL